MAIDHIYNIKQLRSSQLCIRNHTKHLQHCDLVEAEGLEDYFSKEYGVNRRSILEKLPQFDLTICLPHDIMHVILEGVLPRHVKLLLSHYIITVKLLAIGDLNRAMTNVQYSKSEHINKPRPLEKEKLAEGDKLGQSGETHLLKN